MSNFNPAEQITPNCPHCATPMRLQTIVPPVDKLREVRTFICDTCKTVRSIEIPNN